METLSKSTKRFSFEISGANINGPFNLMETALSGQTPEPEWIRDGNSFRDIEVLGGVPVKYHVSQDGDADNFSLTVEGIASRVDGELTANLENHLSRVLGLGDDLDGFYRKFENKDPVLSRTFPNLRGLRLLRSTDLFESLICSMLSQNNSVRLWNRSARLMMQHFGRRVSFPDGSEESLFPEAATLARLNPRSLRSRTSMGYRAKPVVMVSRMIANNQLRLNELARTPYDKAAVWLSELPGVGPKVADCFLLYGAGCSTAAPVDVWIHRIVSKLYFADKKVSRLKTARFLRERFGEWAGYAQLYLFDYARRGVF
jgi:N-glycosylase/DNA lyase